MEEGGEVEASVVDGVAIVELVEEHSGYGGLAVFL